MLLDHGADVNASTIYNETPLWLAAWKQHTHLIALLLDHNADVNTSSNGCQVFAHSYTVLELALGNKDFEAALALYKAGASCGSGSCVLSNSSMDQSETSVVDWCPVRQEVFEHIKQDASFFQLCKALFGEPRSLQNECILCVRRCLRSSFVKRVADLPLPRRLCRLVQKVYDV